MDSERCSSWFGIYALEDLRTSQDISNHEAVPERQIGSPRTLGPSFPSDVFSRATFSSMARIPSNMSLEDLDQILPHIVDDGLPDGGEFVVANLDEGERTASLVAVLVWHGFLPMSGVGLLLGKLHLNRCVLEPRETHVAKKVRKRAKAFRLTVGEAWSQVVEHIQRLTYTSAPGDCWLTDKVVEAYQVMCRNSAQSGSEASSSSPWSCGTMRPKNWSPER
eukprot:s1712_g4.t2